MTETFCGKDCDLCQEKLSEACRGCKEGPGRRFGGDCPIADCCRDKYHANCDTCQEAMNCTKRQQKDQMPQIRIAEAAAKEEKEVQKREKAKVIVEFNGAVDFVLASYCKSYYRITVAG